MSDEDTTVNVKGLEQMIKALKARPPTARVGILGDTNARSGKGTSNATVGAAHEFGTTKLPQRSFLRVPISERLQKEMESSNALSKETLDLVVKTGSVLPWLKGVTILAEKIVNDAFDSGGFGKWQGWKNPSYENNSGMLLVDTQQLRNSITSEVRE